jgi:hypothetical protein
VCVFLLSRFTGGNTLLQMQTIINTIPIHNLQGMCKASRKLCPFLTVKDCKRKNDEIPAPRKTDRPYPVILI